jgi:hypothetical protein
VVQDYACGACDACLTGQPCSVAAACMPDKAATAAARAAARALDNMRMRAEQSLQSDFWKYAAVQDPASLVAVQPLQPLPPLPAPPQLEQDGWEGAGEPAPPNPASAADAGRAAAAPPAGPAATGHKVLTLCSAAKALGLPHVPFEDGWDLGWVCHMCGALGRHAEGRCPAYAPVRQLQVAGASSQQQGYIASSSAAAGPSTRQQQQPQPGQQGAQLEEEQQRGALVAALRSAADTLLARDLAKASSRLDSALSRQQQRRQQLQAAAAAAATSDSEASEGSDDSRTSKERRRQRRAAAATQQPQAHQPHGRGSRRRELSSVAKALQMDGSTFVAIAVLLEEMAAWRAGPGPAAGSTAAAAPGQPAAT